MNKKIFLLFTFFIFGFLPCFAITDEPGNLEFYNFTMSLEKFKNSNVNVAYDEFENIVKNSDNDNAYVNYVLSGKLSDIGLFSLANIAALKIDDKEISQIPLDNINAFFHQVSRMTKEDEIYLADCYSNIMYNNLSKEYASELTANQEIRDKYDYANYLTALAWYMSENFDAANKYIGLALEKNPKNLMYNFLHAKILAELGNKDKAIKIIENAKKHLILTNYYDLKCKEYAEYVYYKTAKTEREKNLHLSWYYYYRGDYLRSLRVMPAINDKNKKEKSQIYMLISLNYVALKEYEKALTNAEKSYKVDKNNATTLMVLGDLKFTKEDYKGALKYYRDAMKKEKGTYNATVRTAKTYMKLDREAKAQELLLKLLRTSSDYYEAYYIIATIEPYKQLAYLKKSVGLNSEFVDGWLELGKYEINIGNFDLAQIYLNNAYTLDESNYKYYYYQGLLYKAQKNKEKANDNFAKCSKLNPKFKAVKKELKK